MEKKLIKNFILDAVFPKFCFRCQREGNYLCQDCLATIDILENYFCLCEKPKILSYAGKCRKCAGRKLNGLYFAASYKNALVKNLIHKFKYDPCVKELSSSLALLIITHFNLIQKDFSPENYILIPVPLSKKKLKKRGFNQSEEIAKALAKFFKIPAVSNCLIKIKETKNQIDLDAEARKENIKECFGVKNPGLISGKNILLVDDVYTTGATMEECARILKYNGANEVWGVAVARG